MNSHRIPFTGVCLAAAIAFALAGCAVSTDGGDDENAVSSGESELVAYDAARGNQIANRALALWNGHHSQNLCLMGVRTSLETSGAVSPAFPRFPSAVAWDNWARANPGELSRRGFQKMNLDVNHIPRGSIITWRPGQCGYSAQYGHIEIVADGASSRACSDYCGNIKKTCGAPGIYVPVGPGGGGGGGGGGGDCSVHGDGRLYCTNAAPASMHAGTTLGSGVVNTLRSRYSWFDCWGTGDLHRGGNRTWYHTLGDDNGNWGWVPAADLNTTSAFDANPTAHGLEHCP